jgi:hypothetical protein
VDLAFVSGALIGLIQVHGPWIIAVVVALESAGVPVCAENPIRVDDVTESPKLAE